MLGQRQRAGASTARLIRTRGRNGSRAAAGPQIERLPLGSKAPREVGEEPRERRRLRRQRQGVDGLRLEDSLPRDAEQVETVMGRGDGQVLQLKETGSAGVAMLAERQDVRQVRRDTADVLGARVGRWERRVFGDELYVKDGKSRPLGPTAATPPFAPPGRPYLGDDGLPQAQDDAG